MNKEFLVIVNHHFPMITSLNFVHTARRSYQLNKKIKLMENVKDLKLIKSLYL